MVEGQEAWVFDGSPLADRSRKQGKAVCKASSVIKEETCPSNWLGKDQAEIQTPDQGSRPSPGPLCHTARHWLAMQISSFCNNRHCSTEQHELGSLVWPLLHSRCAVQSATPWVQGHTSHSSSRALLLLRCPPDCAVCSLM